MSIGKCKSLSNISSILNESDTKNNSTQNVVDNDIISKLAKKSTSPIKLYLGFDRSNNLGRNTIRLLQFNAEQDLRETNNGNKHTTLNSSIKRSKSQASTLTAKKCKLEPLYKLNNGDSTNESDTTESTTDDNTYELKEDELDKLPNTTVVASALSTSAATATATTSKRKCRTKTLTNGESHQNGETNGESLLTSVQTFIDQTLLPKQLRSGKNKLKDDFMSEFELPLTLYSYITLRLRYHPVFLNRNLSYLRANSKKKKPKFKRSQFKVDSLLERLPNKSFQPNGLIIDLDQYHEMRFKSFKTKDLDIVDALNDLTNFTVESFIELYGFNTNNFDSHINRNLFTDSTKSNLLGRCNMCLNDQLDKLDSSFIKFQMKNKYSGEQFGYLYFRLVIVIKKNQTAKATKSPTSSNNSNLINFKEFIILCSLDIHDFRKEKMDVHLKLKDNTFYSLKMKKIPNRVLNQKETFINKHLEFEESWPVEKYIPFDRSFLNINLPRSRNSSPIKASNKIVAKVKTPKPLKLNESKLSKAKNKAKPSDANVSDDSSDFEFNELTNLIEFDLYLKQKQLSTPNKSRSRAATNQQTANDKSSPNKKIANGKTAKNNNNNTSFIYEFNSCELKRASRVPDDDDGFNAKSGKYLTYLNTNQLKEYYNKENKFICPVCYIMCNNLANLAQHFEACHPRLKMKLNPFKSSVNGEPSNSNNGTMNGCNKEGILHLTDSSANFMSYLEQELNFLNGLSIKSRKIHFEVCEDVFYDGNYVGNPFDLYFSSHLGYSESRIRPTKRIPITYVIFNRKKNYIDLSKYANMPSIEYAALNYIQQQQLLLTHEMQPNRAYNCEIGSERIYYHTKSCLPILPNELDIDSDDELDPDWLKEYTTTLINDFDDVNDGEKGIMRLWNSHCLKNNFMADSQVALACELFIRENIHELLNQNLIKNFLLHLANLHDYGLLKTKQLLSLVEYLYEKQDKLELKNKINNFSSLNNSNLSKSNKKNSSNGLLNYIKQEIK